MLSRDAYRAVLLLVVLITVVQGIAVIRHTVWPVEKWVGAW